jgi:hypothetical protein
LKKISGSDKATLIIGQNSALDAVFEIAPSQRLPFAGGRDAHQYQDQHSKDTLHRRLLAAKDC